jgi:hypothetical protein
MKLELSKEQWSQFEEKLLTFIGLKNIKAIKANCFCSGTYKHCEMDTVIKIEEGFLIDGWGNRRKLIPKAGSELHVYNLPLTIKFIDEDNIKVEGQQINERWTTVGTAYKRI